MSIERDQSDSQSNENGYEIGYKQYLIDPQCIIYDEMTVFT